MVKDRFKLIPIQISCEGNKKRLLYPKDWTHRDNFDEFTSYNGYAVKTGKEPNNITVIDVDSPEALKEFQEKYSINLFEKSGFIVKTHKGWHFYFKYNANLSTTTSFKGIKGVDIRNDGANVIIEVPEGLPCASYKILKDEELTELPESLVYIEPEYGSFVKKVEKVKERKGYPLTLLLKELLKSVLIDGHIHYLTDKGKSALKRLTPKIFREGEMGEHYRRIFESKGYIEPNDILEGDGSTYLSRIAAILAADETVSYELYSQTLKHLNRLWANPMDEERLEKTIIKNGNIVIDGKSIWEYNPDWEKKVKESSQFFLLIEEGIDAFYEPNMDKYIIYLNEIDTVYYLNKQSFGQIILSKTGEKFKEWQSLPVKHLTFNPTKDERFYTENGIEYFNIFEVSPLLKLAQKREQPKKKPEIILKILKNLFPNPEKLEVFLHWLGYWFVYREKSLVSWVITSPQGAGKGILTDLIIANVIGAKYCSLEVGEDLLEDKFTGWLQNKMFISFNEINTLTKDRYKNRNKLKRIITGDTFQLRLMNTNPVDYPNYANFIFSTNDLVPVDVEDTDRRYNITRGVKPLSQYNWFKEIEDIREVVLNELPDFVRYVSSLPLDKKKYNYIIPDFEIKKDIMLDNLSPVDEFIHFFTQKDIEYFEDELADRPDREIRLRTIKNWFDTGKAPTSDVFNLLREIVQNVKWTKTKFSRYMKSKGFKIQSGDKRYFKW